MFFWNSLAFLWSNRCRQFDFWFFCLFLIQLEHLKFLVHVLLKPNLKNFEHYFANVWDEGNCAVDWTFFGITFLWDWNENEPFPIKKESKMQYLGTVSKMTKWSVCFQSKPFNIIVIQFYASTSNAEEAEVEQFYEHLENLLELTPNKDVLFFIGDWNVEVGRQ